MPQAQTESEQPKLLGYVRKVYTTKDGGWGFITTSDYRKFFFHSDYVSGNRLPEVRTMVRFRPVKETAEGKNDIAVDIEIVSVPG